eukprot:6473985-Alexandrium_andersonii.AAC.1
MPTVARSTKLVSISKNHMYTANEIDFAMGWPVLKVGENQCYDRAAETSRSLKGLTDYERRLLAGNGMMLPQIAAWL